MSWLSRQPVTRPDHISQTGYAMPVQTDELHQHYADFLQETPTNDDDLAPMGTVVARLHSEEWPGYVGSQHFKAEFTDVTDVVYASQFAGQGYRNNINQDIGGETGAANAIPYWDKGPVRGAASNMTGSVATIKRPHEGAYGDVKGSGPDYARYLANAYYADSMAVYVQEYANAGVMAAI